MIARSLHITWPETQPAKDGHAQDGCSLHIRRCHSRQRSDIAVLLYISEFLLRQSAQFRLGTPETVDSYVCV